MSLISIVTIVRNDLPGLLKTRESIHRQDFRDFEWLIIDGASTDGTAAGALAFRESFLTVISEPDAGLYDAMNKGLERARGQYVLFLNAGDTLVEGALSLVARWIARSTPDFLYGDSFEAFHGHRAVYKKAKGHRRLKYGMFGCHQAMYYRRAFLAEQRYDTSFKIAGDYEFTARILSRHPRITRIDAALCVFDLAGTSVDNKACGRRENWRVQKSVLGMPYVERLLVQAAYLLSAFAIDHVPGVYKWMRYRRLDAG